MATYKYLGDYGADGTILGRAAADKISFYGTSPATQPTSSDQAQIRTTDLTTDAPTNTTNQKQMAKDVNALRTLANRLQADLVTLGLIKGS